jgi:hypothetical protein
VIVSTVVTDISVSRRQALAAGVLGVVTGAAGCTGDAVERAAPAGSAAASDPPASTPVVEETFRVAPGQHATTDFRVEETRWVTVSASLSDRTVDIKHDGPAVDVVILSPRQYERFQQDGQLDGVDGVSMPDVVIGEVTATLEAGTYVALVDNSAAGAAAPGDATVPAVVDLSITTGTPPDWE